MRSGATRYPDTRRARESHCACAAIALWRFNWRRAADRPAHNERRRPGVASAPTQKCRRVVWARHSSRPTCRAQARRTGGHAAVRHPNETQKNWEAAEGVTIKVGATAATRSRRGWSMRHWLAEKQIASAQRDIRTRDRLARAVRIAHPHVRRCAEHG